jgi:hypothetical protein
MPTTFDLVDHAPWSSRRPAWRFAHAVIDRGTGRDRGTEHWRGMNFSLRINDSLEIKRVAPCQSLNCLFRESRIVPSKILCRDFAHLRNVRGS